MKKERAELPAQIENLDWCKDTNIYLKYKIESIWLSYFTLKNYFWNELY